MSTWTGRRIAGYVGRCEINERFYWDANEEILVYALPEEIVKSDETTVDEDGKKILYRDGDAVYLSLALIQKYTDVRLQAYDGEAQKRGFRGK